VTTRICLDCGIHTDQGSRCPPCQQIRTRVIDKGRGTTAQRGLGSAWRTMAKALIGASPWCYRCGATTDLTVDHIVPRAKGGSGTDPANLRVACRSCNSSRGARNDRPHPA